MPQNSAMPNFERPPVSEVALSIEFAPLEKWNSSHGALFWSSIQADYPLLESQPPLMSAAHETFDGELSMLSTVPQFQVLAPDAIRNWLIGDPETWLIQVQRDRFVLNWRKRVGNETYPRYSEIRPRLLREWARFKEFVTGRALGAIAIRLCEVTYVNDVPRGEAWDSISEAAELLSQYGGKGSTGFLPGLETLSLNSSYRFSDPPGRLRFTAQHLLRQVDKSEVFQLQLVARSAPASSEDVDVFSCLDVCRERVVRGFADLTSDKAHSLWGRIE